MDGIVVKKDKKYAVSKTEIEELFNDIFPETKNEFSSKSGGEEILLLLKDLSKGIEEIKEKDTEMMRKMTEIEVRYTEMMREITGIRQQLEELGKKQLLSLVGSLEKLANALENAPDEKSAQEIYTGLKNAYNSISKDDLEEIINDALSSQEESIKREVREQFKALDEHLTKVNNNVMRGINTVGNYLVEHLSDIKHRISSVDSNVDSVKHSVDSIQRGGGLY